MIGEKCPTQIDWTFEKHRVALHGDLEQFDKEYLTMLHDEFHSIVL